MSNTQSHSQSAQTDLDFHTLVEGLGQGILLFSSDDRLVVDNQAARTILGANFALVNSEGWSACAMLLDARKLGGPSANDIRTQALQQAEPIRFHTLLAGAYTPCWATGINGAGGSTYTMITLDQPDWTALNELMSTFREEARMAISSTAGHAELIRQLVVNRPPGSTADQIAERVVGFAGIMATHMYRLQSLMELLERLEVIRTGQLIINVRKDRRKVRLADFVEDFLEELGDQSLADPSQKADLRDRLTLQIPDDIRVDAAPACLKEILRDLLRNAVLYSPAESPITLRASHTQQGSTAQIDVVDQGYGIRAKEAERIFAPFQRARQPQVIAEFGYGLSLYLAKAEVEAMGGRIWYESEEGVGSTFSVKLPVWREQSDDK
jgi:signal transduction histidine kinase